MTVKINLAKVLAYEDKHLNRIPPEMPPTEGIYETIKIDNITLGVKAGEVVNVWKDGLYIPLNVLPNLEQDGIVEFLENQDYFCSKCCKPLSKDEIVGKHFVSAFCAVCWEAYKAENSRPCGLCGVPLWRCTC